MTKQAADVEPVAAVLLAGGASRRFGERNKLLVEIEGTALLRRIAERILAADLAPAIVVNGAEPAETRAVLSGLAVTFVDNPDWAAGMGTSVAAGVAALPASVRGAVIVPGDLPNLSVPMLQRLADMFVRSGMKRIVVPVTATGAQRNPVLWPRSTFEFLSRLSGERGGKTLLDTLGRERLDVVFDDDSLFTDIDTPDDLARYLSET